MRLKIKYYISVLFRNSWVQHILFWLLAYIVLLSVFASDNYKLFDIIFNPIADTIYTIIFIFTLLLAVMINLYLLIPVLLKRSRYLFYTLGFLTVLFSFSFFNQLIFDKWIDYLLPGYYFISYYDYWDIVVFFAVFLSGTTLLKLSKEWFELNESRHKLVRLEKERAEAELKALMGQINPHFLFNSLNVLYNLALKTSTETPSAIIKLSDILRYVIYEAGKKRVLIQSEAALIRNYIDLQHFRVDKKNSISFDTNISDNNQGVAPMLFLPLVENSFKHGIKGTIDKAFVNIKLNTTENGLEFMIENNKEAEVRDEKEESSGIGLKNISERLELLYAGRYRFEIMDEQDKFKVKLALKLTNEDRLPDN